MKTTRSQAPSDRSPKAARRPPARAPRSRPGAVKGRRVAIVGAGRVGSAMAIALAKRDWPVTAIASRRLPAARALARRCGAALATTDPATAAGAADVVLLAVPDRVLPGMARDLAARGLTGRGGGLVVLHTSGASGASVLAPLRARHVALGSFHPLLSFPIRAAGTQSSASTRRSASLFEDAAIAIDGDPVARRVARRLARSLGAHPVAVPASARARYHLAACFASNYVVTLVWEATRLLEKAGIPRGRTLRTLLPLIRSTVANLEAVGLPRALTGPVARGDDVTVARHAAALRRADPELRDLHRRLVARTAHLARAAGWLTPSDVERFERLRTSSRRR